MISKTKTLLATIAALWTVAAPAATLTDTYSSLVVFGDSLSDIGNVFAQTGGAFPPPPYFNGQFSNDAVWADQVGQDFTNAGRLSLNFAFGGAKAVTDADTSPDLAFQVDLFKGFTQTANAAFLGPRPLGVVFFGGNDLFAAAKEADALQLARAAARAVREQVETLAGLGLRDLVLVNSIDISGTPRVLVEGDSDPKTASLASKAFNEIMARQFVAKPVLYNDVRLFDFAALSAGLLADPASAGITNVTDACIVTLACIGFGQQDSFLFWDSVHPNGVAHSLIADAFRLGANQSSLLVSPVPLPAGAWSLLGALALLGAARAVRRG